MDGRTDTGTDGRNARTHGHRDGQKIGFRDSGPMVPVFKWKKAFTEWLRSDEGDDEISDEDTDSDGSYRGNYENKTPSIQCQPPRTVEEEGSES